LLEKRRLMAPVVQSIVRAEPLGQNTNATSVDYTATFDQPVTGVAASDFQVITSNSDPQGTNTVVVTPVSSSVYTVAVNGTTSGNLQLNLVDNDSILGVSPVVPLGGVGAGNGNFQGQLYTIEQVAPVVLWIDGTSPTLGITTARALTFTVTFSQGVTGVDVSDFALATTSNASGTIASVTQSSPSIYTVVVDAITGVGSLGLNLADNNSIRDLAGNPLSQPNAAASFSGQVTYATQTRPYSVAVADLNGDGIPDMVVANYGSGTVGVLLGNGDGTFHTEVTYDAGNNPISVAVADLNHDGDLDLVVANQGSSSVSVLLGNGNGTFQPLTSFAAGQYPESVSVADLNGDGNPDIVVTDEGDHGISVLLGNGDGTFQSQTTYLTGGSPRSATIADVNGDGIPDIIVADYTGNDVSVLLGNGDGTFQTETSYATGNNPRGVAVADVNGDGKPDIIVANYFGGSVSVLLGNGDGTFADQNTFAVGGDPEAVVVGDVNGDGIPDLVVANYGGSYVSVHLGNGDGDFAAQTTYETGNQTSSVALADLNGDGRPDIVTANFVEDDSSVNLNNGNGNFTGQVYTLVENSTTSLTSSNDSPVYGQTVTFTATVAPQYDGTATGTVTFFDGELSLGTGTLLSPGVWSFTTSTLAIGSHPDITADYGGDDSFVGSDSPAFSETVGQASTTTTTTTTLNSSNASSTFGESVTFTATVAPQDNGVATGSVNFYDNDTLIGTGTLDESGVATLDIATLAAGSHPMITATYEGDSNDVTSTSADFSQTIGQASTTTTLASSNASSTLGQPFTLTATITGQFGVLVSGTVSFFDGSTQLGTSSVNNQGVATFVTSDLGTSAHELTAVFDGDSNLLGSTSESVTVTITQSQTTTTVTGQVYLDLNANGVLNAGEPGLAGRVVFLDLNHDGTLDPGDPTATTDANGNFTLTSSVTGSFAVVEATDQDANNRYVVDQTVTNTDGSVSIGVVPISPVAPVPVVPNPFSASPSSDANTAFVQSLYKAVLGRTGGDSEVAGWLVKLNDGTTEQEVVMGFINSPEHCQDEVNCYYEEFLHRAPDPSSTVWVNELLAGVSEETITEDFLDSPEYQAANQDSTQFVENLYLDVLGRQGDSSEVAGWLTALASGTSRESVVASFVQSTEAIDQVVDSFYTAYLHRQAEPVSSDVWATMLEQPDGLASDVATGILASPEIDQDATTSQGD
jgi:hypothetical protein